MPITKANFIVQPQFDGSPGILTGSGAPGVEVYDLGTIYNRDDSPGVYMSAGGGVWTQILDGASAIASHPATASAGTIPAFTGSASTAAVAEPFTGTGYSTVGQVVTTTDNQTMALNECARMWLICATKPPCLITGNTAVTGAPAVLTVFGLAPATTAEGYKILKAPTPTGAVASHTHDTPILSHVITP